MQLFLQKPLSVNLIFTSYTKKKMLLSISKPASFSNRHKEVHFSTCYTNLR